MSSPEEPAGGSGSDQPVVPPHPSQQPEHGTQNPTPGGDPAQPGAQPYPGADAAYPGQPAAAYPGQPPTAEGAYGAYPAPGQAYGTPPYGSQPYAGQPYGSQPYAAQPYGAQPYAGQPYGAQPYGAQQYPTAYPGYPGYGQVFPRNDLGVWSLVLGIAGIAFGFNLLTGIPAILLGRRAKQAVARGEANNDGVATAGIVLGWIATGLGALLVIFIVGAIIFGIATSSSGTSY